MAKSCISACCTQFRWRHLADSVMTKLPTLGKALRSQALYHLCETDKEWQASWAPDNAWDNITEGGPPAKDLKTFVSEVLHPDIVGFATTGSWQLL